MVSIWTYSNSLLGFPAGAAVRAGFGLMVSFVLVVTGPRTVHCRLQPRGRYKGRKKIVMPVVAFPGSQKTLPY